MGVEKVFVERWGSTNVLSRGRTHDVARLPALVAEIGDGRILVISEVSGRWTVARYLVSRN